MFCQLVLAKFLLLIHNYHLLNYDNTKDLEYIYATYFLYMYFKIV